MISWRKNWIIFCIEIQLIADALKKRIEQNERERKELAGIQKLANERAKKANLHNKKLRDCRFHYNDEPTGKDKDNIH